MKNEDNQINEFAELEELSYGWKQNDLVSTNKYLMKILMKEFL